MVFEKKTNTTKKTTRKKAPVLSGKENFSQTNESDDQPNGAKNPKIIDNDIVKKKKKGDESSLKKKKRDDFEDTLPLKQGIELLENLSFEESYLSQVKKFFQEMIITETNFWEYFFEHSQAMEKSIQLMLESLPANGQWSKSHWLTAQTYVLMLSTPGSQAYSKLFHPNMLRLILCNLRAWKKAQVSETEQSLSKMKIEKTKPKKKAVSKKGRASKSTPDSDDDQEDDPMDDLAESPSAAHSFSSVKGLLQLLSVLLDHFSFEKQDETKNFFIETFLDMMRYHSESQDETNQIIEMSRENLILLVDPKHGEPKDIASRIFKCAIPSLLMVYSSKLPSNPPKYHQAASDTATEFIKELLSSETLQLQEVGQLLLRNLCLKVPEKAEYRTKACQVIATLFDCLNKQIAHQFILFVEQLSKNTKSNARLFATELAAKLIRHFVAYIQTDKESQGKEFATALLPLLVARANDKMAAVRSKALSLLGDLFKNITLLNDLFKTLQTSSEERTQILNLIRRRNSDERPAVRKSALQLLESLALITDEYSLQQKDTLIFHTRSQDLTVSVRTQAAHSICKLFEKFPSSPIVCQSWVEIVLPLVLDPEGSLQKFVTESVQKLLFEKVKKSKTFKDDIWMFSNYINSEMESVFLKLMAQIGKSMDKAFVKNIQKLLKQESDAPVPSGAWLLLSLAAPFCASSIDIDLILQLWYKIKSSPSDIACYRRVLKIFEVTGERIPADDKKIIMDDLTRGFNDLSIPVSLITPTINALNKLTNKNFTFFGPIVSKCDEYLAPILGKDSNQINLKLVAKCIFTIGEITSIISLKIVPTKLKTMIQALVTSKTDQISRIPEIRAHAILCLGKFCLQDQSLASKYVSLLAKELEQSPHPSVRNNVILVMSDLLTSHTNVVESYLPTICKGLKDSNELVRKHTLLSLYKLIESSYIRMDDILFFKVATCLTDPSNDIRHKTQACIVNYLLIKDPNFFFKTFTEAIFTYNDCKQHAIASFLQGFHLPGIENRENRMNIYRVFLVNMTEIQRFQLITKICQKIFTAFLDEKTKGLISLRLTPETSEILHDAFSVLSCSEIKIKKKTGQADNEQEEAVSNAKDMFVSAIMRKTAVEQILPLIIELKHLLESKHSPLLKDLWCFLSVLLKDYRTEMDDIAVASPQLAKEIEFIRKNEQKETDD